MVARATNAARLDVIAGSPTAPACTASIRATVFALPVLANTCDRAGLTERPATGKERGFEMKHGMTDAKAAKLGFLIGDRVYAERTQIVHDVPAIGQTTTRTLRVSGTIVAARDGGLCVKPDVEFPFLKGADGHCALNAGWRKE